MESEKVVVALEALAQASRLGIFRLLVEAGPNGLSAGQIAAHLRLPAPTLSFHLSQLKHAQLASCQRASRSLIYSANFGTMNELVAFLTENCCGVGPELCAPAGVSLRAGKRGKRK
ncbi:MAG TPA: helix-turn-helix domain-containing protein [Burkholderiales bacterium]